MPGKNPKVRHLGTSPILRFGVFVLAGFVNAAPLITGTRVVSGPDPCIAVREDSSPRR